MYIQKIDLDKNTTNFKKYYPRDTIHLGLVLAGGVSAGTYSAGAMTYFLQNMHAWEELKNENYKAMEKHCDTILGNGETITTAWIEEHIDQLHKADGFDQLIPMYDVVIETMTGSSAGSLVAAISSLSLGYKQSIIDPDELLNPPSSANQNFNKQIPVNKLKNEFKDNLLFDSWVNLNNNQKRNGKMDVLDELLQVGRHESNGPFSLLNNAVLNSIGAYQLERLFPDQKKEITNTGTVSNTTKEINQTNDPSNKIQLATIKSPLEKVELPGFISEKFKVFFSVTSLRGVSISVVFEGGKPQKEIRHGEEIEHKMRQHALSLQFTRNNEDDAHMKWNPGDEEAARRLINSALASGAFPIGLPPRHLDLKPAYLKAIFKKSIPDSLERIRFSVDENHIFEFAAVDGGTLNNEPFIEAMEFIQEQSKDANSTLGRHWSAVIMIDPFPNYEEKPDPFSFPTSLTGIVWTLIRAIRGQAMNKDLKVFREMNTIIRMTENEQSETTSSKGGKESKIDKHKEGPGDAKDQQQKINRIELNSFKLGLMAPLRRTEHGNETTPVLATEAMAGFGGFLKKEFRLHDFYLGMKNAQGFIQDHFESEGGGRIIPDIASIRPIVNAKNVQTKNSALPHVAFPHITYQELIAIRPLITRRLYFLLGRLWGTNRKIDQSDQKENKRWGSEKLHTLMVLTLIIPLFSAAAIIVWFYIHLDVEMFWLLIIAMGFIVWLICNLVMYSLTILIIRKIGNELFTANQLIENEPTSK